MALIIVGILVAGYLLIATESLTNVNKAAVAIFACTVGWVLYISYGTDFVMGEHAAEYTAWLGGAPHTSTTVKEFIAGTIFLKYVGRACEIVLFLLATSTIVEILDNNGCFDFVTQWLKTRSSRRMLWMTGVATFLISANLDNLTTTVMMLVMIRKVVPNRRQRMLLGSAIVVAANCGGAMTVIGSPAGLMLWNGGLVTASCFSMALALPCLLAWAIPTWWLGRSLPEHLDVEWGAMTFRGDDTRLRVWQRLVMLVLGIGGLWFIPTFHSITKLSPFLGALCVLSLLWVVNEVFNRHLLNMDGMSARRVPRVMVYGNHQMILFVMGMILALGVVKETGALADVWDFLRLRGLSETVMALTSGVTTMVMDNFATASTYITLNPSGEENGAYWKLVAYLSAVGGNVLAVGSISGLALMRTEKMHVGWYVANVGWKALVGMLVGLAALGLTLYLDY